jgi:methylated-DNA-protein-cysteine methyltransferase-like protein
VEINRAKKEKVNFSKKVYQITKEIPFGQVATYGLIARKMGRPQAARAVGNALHRNPDPKTIPCYRVVNQVGRLAPGFKEQKRKLLNEGVVFKDKKHVDLRQHLWQKSG